MRWQSTMIKKSNNHGSWPVSPPEFQGRERSCRTYFQEPQRIFQHGPPIPAIPPFSPQIFPNVRKEKMRDRKARYFTALTHWLWVWHRHGCGVNQLTFILVEIRWPWSPTWSSSDRLEERFSRATLLSSTFIRFSVSSHRSIAWIMFISSQSVCE